MTGIVVWIFISLVFLGGLVFLGFVREHQLSRERNMALEGFGMEEKKAEPLGTEEKMLAPIRSIETEKLVASSTLIPQTEAEAVSNWSNMTSERCYRRDVGETLKKTRNYLQRTNNYQHTYPDSCSAPNHEFVGTFYRPHEGIGSAPKTGLPLPPSTQSKC
jgi:hypothetical protein